MRKLSQSHLGSFLKEMLHKECEQEAASKGEGRTRLYRCMRGFVTGWATSQTERKEVAVSFLYSVISRFSDLGPCRAYAEGTAAPLVALAFFLAGPSASFSEPCSEWCSARSASSTAGCRRPNLPDVMPL